MTPQKSSFNLDGTQTTCVPLFYFFVHLHIVNQQTKRVMQMTNKLYLKKCYGQAVQSLPPRLRGYAMQQNEEVQCSASEFRLRAGQQLVISTPQEEIIVKTDSPIRHEELGTMLEMVTEGSLHSVTESLKNGYVTISGGHRIGLCGTAVTKQNEITFIKNLSSASVRIARELPGVADDVLPRILQNGAFENTLIVSAPGFGKTTLLRDLIRKLSDGEPHYRISLIDERGEVAAKWHGVAQLDVGRNTDVLDGAPKAEAILLLLRAMSPQIIAMDEITAPQDLEALKFASHCGVGILATAHGYDIDCLMSRPLYREMMECKIFQYCVVLSVENGIRKTNVVEL